MKPVLSILPRIAAGECFVCIGMSEPDAGSDLAGVRTPADRAPTPSSVQSALAQLRFSPAGPALPNGVARTSIDRSLAGGGVTASAGFLCGRHAGPDNNGAAMARGYDPEGRFVGAKLSFAFR